VIQQNKLFLPILVFAGTILTSPIIAAAAQVDAPNLVPEKPATAANYWCTWYAQNYWQQRGGEITDFEAINNPNAREELSYMHLYDPQEGWANTYLPRGRSDYFFLVDHGWQTKDKTSRLPGSTDFFSLQIDASDFPPYANKNPAESLRLFNEQIKGLGWRGLGLWTRGEISQDAARRMVEWSKQADIQYWKIDGGGIKNFYSYKIKEEIFPELTLEYICGANGPLNPNWGDASRTEYPSPFAAGAALNDAALRIMRNCDVFRTYDVAPILVSTSTMRRIHDILEQTQNKPEFIARLNIQDDTQVAAAMGCLVACKRHPNYMERTLNGEDFHHQITGKRMIQHRMNEVERLGRWQRIAPAFPAGEGSYLSSDHDLVDHYVHTKLHTWYKPVYGKMVYQSAPAIMCRNMPLPTVEFAGEAPYVMASHFPNGPVCVATEGRVSPEDQWFEPRAKVTLQIKDAAQPIGVFGHYEELVLDFAGGLEGVTQVWAQDLLADQAIDIKGAVTISGRTLSIPGDLIDRIGTAENDEGDISLPGLVIRLEGSSLLVAGDDFIPPVKVRQRVAQKGTAGNQRVDGYQGTAEISKTPYGYKVGVKGSKPAVVLKKLSKTYDTGKLTIRWKMMPANDRSTKNGFLVLSADENGASSVMAGTFTGSGEMTIFENGPTWGNAPKKKVKLAKEMTCKLVVDLDARKATLTLDGSTMSLEYSESMTTIGYIGFGVQNAETLFTQAVVK
jgi:hypothetical protein